MLTRKDRTHVNSTQDLNVILYTIDGYIRRPLEVLTPHF